MVLHVTRGVGQLCLYGILRYASPVLAVDVMWSRSLTIFILDTGEQVS